MGNQARIACIDFETANEKRGSICAAGVAVYEGEKLVQTGYWLIKPHDACGYFSPFNVGIHGITADDVASAPSFIEALEEMRPMLQGAVLAAHNAAFDMSALRAVLDLYGQGYPVTEYVCSYQIARRTWAGLDSYSLPTVCRAIGYTFKHHNALEDAIACGRVVDAALARHGAASVHDLADRIGLRIGSLGPGGYVPCGGSKYGGRAAVGVVAQTDAFDKENEFYRKKVVFTGTLARMSRKEAMQQVVNLGGYISDVMTDDVDYLVMGIQDYAVFADGKESSKTKKAKKMIQSGRTIQIIREDEFYLHLEK